MDQATQQRSARIVTEVPGPRSRAILERKDAAVAACMSIYAPVAAVSAEGATITDADGNTFIDFAGGVGVMNVGHRNPHVTEAIHRQVDAFTHTDFTVLFYENYVRLAERLGASVPISGPVKTAFFNSGAEAVENAVKIARASTGRKAVICFDRAFHGRTLMAMTLTSKTHPYKAGFGPFAPEVYRAPYPSPYHDELDAEASAKRALAGLRGMFKTHVAPEDVAAIILEPVQGEGGFIVPPASWVQGIRDICDEHGIVMVDDEVQAGMGRTGTLWAIEQLGGVEPDLILTAKSLAAGLPLSGVIGKASIMDAVPDSGIGGTYVGNPIGCEAGNAVLDELEGGLLARGREVGERLRHHFDDLQRAFPVIGDVRGLGPMLAMEFGTPDAPDGDRATAVAEQSLRRGLLVLKAGVHGNCLRTLVPLMASDELLDEACEILRAALEATAEGSPAVDGNHVAVPAAVD